MKKIPMYRKNKNGDDLECCVEPEKMTVEELIWAVKELRKSNRILTDMIPIDYILEQAKIIKDEEDDQRGCS